MSDPQKPLKRMDGEPAFDAPWQVEALAMANALIDAGVIGAPVWSERLGAELRESDDTVGGYYAAVLRALEGILDRADLVPQNSQAARKQAWERAYLNTPHGQPVRLEAGLDGA